MDLIGKPSINPILFYSGKLCGYFTWIVLFLSILNINIINRIEYKYNEFIAYIILSIGLFLSIISMINLGKSTRLGLPSGKTNFKTNGLYKISRNPMYLGFDLLTLSSIIYALNLWIIIPGFYSIIIYHFIILGEEKFLSNIFGTEYINYKKKVRRYL